LIIDRPEASRPVKDTAPNLSQGMFAKMSDQHYRKVQERKELEEQKRLDGDPLTWNGNETRISFWSMLDDGPAPGGTPEADDRAPDDTGLDSDMTLSDDSDASIYGLRRTIHKIERGDELSDSSSQDNGMMALVDRRRVHKWREDHTLLDDEDFANVFVDFDEAYYNTGRAVSSAWSKAKIQSDPGIVTDSSRLSAVEVTAAKIRAVDKRRKKPSNKKKRATQPDITDKARFVEPLVQLMMTLETRANHPRNLYPSSAQSYHHRSRIKRIS
jgi:hypothetical protein